MGALIGFVVGYVVGARAGTEGLEKLREAWQGITESDEFQGLLATGTSFVRNALARGGAAVTEQLEAVGSGKGPLGDTWRSLTRDGELAKAVCSLTESSTVQELLSGGATLLGGMLERGMTALDRGGMAGRR